MSIIHLIAPSGYCIDQQAAWRGVERLQAAGIEVTNQQVISRRYQRFAGTDTQRLQDINQLATLPTDNQLVLAVRGGYGASRLLAHIDYASLAERYRQSTLLLCGHSDFTAIQLALLARCQMVTLSGPMLAANFGAPVLESFSWRHFCQAASGEPFTVCWQSAAPPCQLQGRLWGGNLAMLTSLVGTGWLPEMRGGILLLEEVNEPLYRIERMLWQLHHAGILVQQSVIILGDLSGAAADTGSGNQPASTIGSATHTAGCDDYNAGYDLPALLHWLRALTGRPVLSGLAFGHCPRTVTLPLGVHAHLQHDGVTASLRVSGYHGLGADVLKYDYI